jgi:citrate/tricarballylate utilization protein
MRETEAVAETRRDLEICNACRYCESYCAVFPAMTLRREFAAADIGYLANLCHNCQGCYHACQYAPPHPFGVNLPQAFARVRAETYEEYAWPPAVAGIFRRNGVAVALTTALGLALVLALTIALSSPDVLYAARPVRPGSFYAVIPLRAMQVTALATFGYAVLALAIGARAFWRDAGAREPVTRAPARDATSDVLTLRNLGGGGHGCNDIDERFSMTRRWLHHALFYGFLLCFASTSSAFLMATLFGWAAPYSLFSLPVVLGTLGGVGLLAGATGLFAIKLAADPAPAARDLLGADVALLMLLGLAAATGLALLALRGTGAMGVTLAAHLGVILALFVVLPYSKMVHGVYRSAALLRNAIERRR